MKQSVIENISQENSYDIEELNEYVILNKPLLTVEQKVNYDYITKSIDGRKGRHFIY